MALRLPTRTTSPRTPSSLRRCRSRPVAPRSANPRSTTGPATEAPRPAHGAGAVAATLALLAFGANMASPLYPGYQAAFGFGDLTLTIVYATYAVVSVPALLVLGPVGDRVGWRPLLRLGLLLGALGSLCFALATGPAWLLVGRVAHGLALGAATGAGMAALVARAAPGHRARASTLGGMAFVAGTAAGPAVTGLIAQYVPGSAQSALALHLVALAIVAAWLRTLPAPTAAAAPRPRTRRAPQWTRPQIPTRSRRAFTAAASTGAVSWTVVGLFLGLIPTVVARTSDTGNLAVLGAVVAVVLGAALPAQLVVSRLGARTAQRAGLALLAASLTVLAITGADAGVAGLVVAAVLAGLGHGLAYGGAHDAVQTIGDLDPSRAAGLNAAAYIVFYLGAGLPAVGVGLLTLSTTLPVAVTTLAIAALLAAGVAAAATVDPHADPHHLQGTPGDEVDLELDRPRDARRRRQHGGRCAVERRGEGDAQPLPGDVEPRHPHRDGVARRCGWRRVGPVSRAGCRGTR